MLDVAPRVIFSVAVSVEIKPSVVGGRKDIDEFRFMVFHRDTEYHLLLSVKEFDDGGIFHFGNIEDKIAVFLHLPYREILLDSL